MRTLGLRSLAACSIAALALLGVAAPAANALTRSAPAVTSFVGTYTVHVTITGEKPSKSFLQINADGTALDKHGNVAHWTAKGTTITINYSDKTVTEQFVGKKSKNGIGTKKKPGTFTTTVGDGTWYAVLTN